jgi:hypothetical protein
LRPALRGWRYAEIGKRTAALKAIGRKKIKKTVDRIQNDFTARSLLSLEVHPVK